MKATSSTSETPRACGAIFAARFGDEEEADEEEADDGCRSALVDVGQHATTGAVAACSSTIRSLGPARATETRTSVAHSVRGK